VVYTGNRKSRNQHESDMKVTERAGINVKMTGIRHEKAVNQHENDRHTSEKKRGLPVEKIRKNDFRIHAFRVSAEIPSHGRAACLVRAAKRGCGLGTIDGPDGRGRVGGWECDPRR